MTIANDKERRITAELIERFSGYIKEMEKSPAASLIHTRSPYIGVRLMLESIRSQQETLKEELKEYDERGDTFTGEEESPEHGESSGTPNKGENPLCPHTIWVCPFCGWWEPKHFDCRHMVTAQDGNPAYRDYSAERTHFYLR